MKQFEIPTFYKSEFIGPIKNYRKALDPRKRDFTPTIVDFGSLKITLARHFGFCYGVENAIEIAYKAIEENQCKNIYMLSQMIHNPVVNQDLQDRGLSFILDTEGNQLTPWEKVTSKDIVIIPAFGTTLEIEKHLKSKGIETHQYNTTCPFVEKVWKMANKLGTDDYSIIIHGKFKHEETQATFSHSSAESKSVVIKDIDEARVIGDMILGQRSKDEFYSRFEGRYSKGFNIESDLLKVGVINQTTMLASETHEISEYFKSVMIEKYGEPSLKDHFADTRDTLCYATNDNQQSTYELLNEKADIAIVVGGYNSSNTSHLADLCATKFKTYFVNGPNELLDNKTIRHFDYASKSHQTTKDYLPLKDKINVVVTSGASCPDSVIESVIDKLLSFYPSDLDKSTALKNAGVTG
ncbi:4-hydroxy-3-methylbut-2-enyl diphosphate reductase [Salibacteraceae bacterium]|nr:4-hydroxy-3-methylbut-2-enyl diphosphate reductase [Salibacteraceae bacterium]MDB9710305.1 4-hydroxy-3-methylbut-2-enyl diphosphate reductase [Salibacteraceae bacterium]